MKRLLFVDDEPALLDALRGRLRTMRSEWEMVFVESASRALVEMEQRPCDVIVSDMRMPGMDGVQLLSTVRERWPETIRLVLSGYAEDEQSQRLLSIAHQYLSKPCEPQQLENVIKRCIQLHALLTEPGLRASVGHVGQLPAVPQIFSKLCDVLEKPGSCVREVAAVVYEDPAIAAKVLQIVNSSFFRLTRRITRIDQAISHLGFNLVRTIALSAEVFCQWRPQAVIAGITPERLMRRAHRVAAAVGTLSQGTPIVDEAVLAGLFHNIGYWVLLQDRPQDLMKAIETARSNDMPLYEAEIEVIGASNAQIGAYLLGLWGLAYPIVEAIAFQHQPERVGQRDFDVLAALITGERLAMAESPLIAGVLDRTEMAIGDEYLQALHAPFTWSQAQTRVSASLVGESAT